MQRQLHFEAKVNILSSMFFAECLTQGTRMSSQQIQNETGASEHIVQTSHNTATNVFNALISLGFPENKIRNALKVYEVSCYIHVLLSILYYCPSTVHLTVQRAQSDYVNNSLMYSWQDQSI